MSTELPEGWLESEMAETKKEMKLLQPWIDYKGDEQQMPNVRERS